MTRKSDCTSFFVVNVDSLFPSCSSSSMLSVVLSAVTLFFLVSEKHVFLRDRASGFADTGANFLFRIQCAPLASVRSRSNGSCFV